MKFLVIGSGGREHAIIKQLKSSSKLTAVHVAPGNGMISELAQCHPSIAANNIEGVVDLAKEISADVVFVGPEDPLVAGLADRLREAGILVVGPDHQGAKLEGSKSFCKEFLIEAGIPTAGYEKVNSVARTLEVARKWQPPYVLKADGLAAGKGVAILNSLQDLEVAATNYFEKKIFGAAGSTAVLEEFMEGGEISFLALTNGQSFQSLPVAMDHKRLFEGGKGPNTGGMGTVAPISMPSDLLSRIEKEIVAPAVELLGKKKITYRGVLFFGIMLTKQGPKVIEINCRFGDPETQVILPLIENDAVELWSDLAQGKLQELRFHKNKHTACVVLAAPGYPEQPQKDLLIEGNPQSKEASAYWLAAGVRKDENGKLRVAGGRVLNAIGIGNSRESALQKAYELLPQLKFEGAQYRRDIGSEIPQL